MIHTNWHYRAILAMTLLLIVSMFSSAWARSNGQLDRYAPYFKAILLADAETGEILYEEQQHRKVIPASLVKMMGALIIFENIHEGTMALEDQIPISPWASRIGGRQVYLKQGEVFTLHELMKAMIIFSANDAAVAIGEYVAGSQKAFVQLMNRRAQELYMTNTVFRSPHGLPPGRRQQADVTTAYDLSVLARELLQYPEYLEYASTELAGFRNGTYQLLNTNRPLLRSFPGLDGMKTGYNRKAGFNLVATAKRGEQRFVSIVLGAPNPSWRRRLTNRLLTMGFTDYDRVKIAEKGTLVSRTVPVVDGSVESLALKVGDDVSMMLTAKEQSRLTTSLHLPHKISAPVQKGEVVGRMVYRLDNQVMTIVALLASHTVNSQNFLGKMIDSLKDIKQVFEP